MPHQKPTLSGRLERRAYLTHWSEIARLARLPSPAGCSGNTLLKATIAMLLAAPATHAGDSPAAAGPADGVDTDGPLGFVLVTADQISLPKYHLKLLQTPQTAIVVPKGLMEEQAVTSLRDALRNVSGISIGAGEGSYQGDNFSIRGFAARTDMYLDGMSDWGNYTRDSFDSEEVEVLKGPSSVAFGRGAVGGVINVESKMPRLRGFTEAQLEYGTEGTRRATLDLDTPLPTLPGAALRVNAMVHKSDIAGRPGPYYSRWGLAPSVAVGLGTPTRMWLGYFLLHENDLPDFGIPWINDRPAPVPRGAYYGFTGGANFFDADVQIGTARIEHDFDEHLTLKEQFRISNYYRNLDISQADPPSDGDIPPALLPGTLVERTQIDDHSTDRSVDQALDLLAHFQSGDIRHSVDLGSEFLRQSVDPRRYEPCWVGVTATPLLNPSPGDPFTGMQVVPGQTCTNVDAHTDELSAYLIDSMRLGERWVFLGAIRADHVTSHYHEWSPATALAFEPGPLLLDWHADNTLPSFRAALVYRPTPAGSIYLSTGTSIHPNVAQIAISNETPLIPPPDWSAVPISRSAEVEIGTKWSLEGGRLSLTSALYWDQLKGAGGVDVDDPLNYVTGARERIRGAELGLAGHLTAAWQMWFTYTYQDGIVTGSSDPTLLGQQVLNSPKNSGSLWSTYELGEAWEVGLGLNGVSTRLGWEQPDPNNGRVKEGPGYLIGSAMLKYQIARGLDVQANVSNITNKYYYDGVHPGHVVPGPGRALYFNLTWRR
jgi:catecholate siderophore receptor